VLNVRTRSDAGTALGFAGSVRYRRFEFGVHYAEGTLQPTDPQAEVRDLVEGAVALRFLATPWLTFHVGPQARSYATQSGTERWVTWQAGGRGEAAIVGTSVRGYATLWRALGLNVNLSPGSGSARGGEVGVIVDLPPRPFWFSLAYGIDQSDVPGAGRRETVESLTFTAGLRRR
jgi:hypothetical protein